MRIKPFHLLLLILFCSGCPKAEKSASMALDNANEVIDHTSEKVFVDPDEAAAAQEEREEQEDRYY